MILKCTCDHKFQDEQHGAQMRVFNRIPPKPPVPEQWRCTVCERVVSGKEKKA